MRCEADACLTAKALCCLLECLTDRLTILLALLGRLEAAQLSLKPHHIGNRIARAASADAPNIDAGLILSQRALRITGFTENRERVHRSRQILAWMACASPDLNIECFIRRALRDYHASRKSIIENQAMMYI